MEDPLALEVRKNLGLGHGNSQTDGSSRFGDAMETCLVCVDLDFRLWDKEVWEPDFDESNFS